VDRAPSPLRPEEAALLYEKYGFFLLRRCRTLLRDGPSADDALQQAFEQILRSGGAVKEASAPLRWLYRVVDRCCYDVLRRRRRSMESPGSDELGETAHPAVDIEARDAVLKLLGTMSEQEMQIAVLLFVDGMSQGEIADEVGVSRVTVNKKIQALRARAEHYSGRPS
jgi:RNA polymerase sigma-70 factor (ECF subfamily)